MRLSATIGAGFLLALLLGVAGGTSLVAQDLAVNVTLTIPNSAPVVDLNGGAAGVNSQASFTITGGPVAIVDAIGLTVVDLTNGSLAQAQVQLVNHPDGNQETLDVTLSGGITKSYDANTGLLTLNGPATVAAFQAVLRTLTYNNASAFPSVADRTIQVTVSDGALPSAIATSTVSLVSGVANLVVLPSSSAGTPLITNEHGAMQLVSIRLSSIPSGSVQVLLSNPRTDEVSLSTTTLTFIPATWNLAQIVLITGLADGVVDTDQLLSIPVTVNAPNTDYAGVTASPIIVLNRNVDVPGLSLAGSGSGQTVVQEGGATDTISAVLTARPAGTVTVTITGGGGSVIASPTTLAFTNSNWNLPQLIRMTAVDDAIINGTRSVTMQAAASGSGYTGVSATRSVTVLDNDVAGVEVTPTTGLVTNKSGLQAQVNIRLVSQPTADVSVPVSSSNIAIGTLSTAALTFTAQNWNSYQTVTLSGVQDGAVTGDQPWSLVTGFTTSTDTAFDHLNPLDASAINRDTNRTALLVSPGSVVVNQGGATASIQVQLASRPANSVTVTVVSSKTAEATVGPASLIFTGGAGSNWNTPQSVTVTGLPSGSVGPQTFLVTCTPSGDAAYAALAPVVVTGVNQDINQPTVLVDLPAQFALVEGTAGTVSYDVRLSTDPGLGNTIVVTPTPADGQLAVTSAATLTFTHGNYSSPQTVTVVAVDDQIAQGPHSVYIQNLVSGSYQSVTVAIPLTDNNQAGIVASPQGGLITTQIGGSATFTVHLTSKPTAPVTIPLTSSDPNHGTVSPASLTFLPTGATAWNLPQLVTVIGADGLHTYHGDVPYQIAVGPAMSTDSGYDQLAGSPVGVINQWVNLPPTIAAITDLNINQDTGTQVVSLSSISDGGEGEQQVVTVTANSNNPGLTGPLTVAYTNPAITGTMTFTVATHAFGTATITVQVSDGVATVQRQFQVQVAQVNQRPVLVRNTPLTVNFASTGAYQGLNADPAALGQLVASDVETAAAALVYRVVLAPGGGHVTRSNVSLVNGDTFTQAEVDAGAVIYHHDAALGTSDGFVIRVEDANGGYSDPAVVSVVIVRSPPVLTLNPVNGATWSENGPALAIAPAATLSAANSVSFDGGSCTVSELSGGQTGDLLTVRNDGTGAGFIGFSGATVSYGGVPIAASAGGAYASPLTVTFNAQATTAGVEALIRAITFAHQTQNPSTTARVLQTALVDGHGDAATLQTCTIAMQPANTAPTVAPLSLAAVSGSAITGRVTATDPDGPSLSFSLFTNPQLGSVSGFDAATGSFIYTPDANAVGVDTFQVKASDSIATSAAATVTVVITSPTIANRLVITSDPPLEAQAGERLHWVVKVDGSEVTPAPDLQFALDDAPSGMVLTADAANATASITWPTVAGSGYVRFRVRVWDALSLVSDVQAVCVFVHPLPTVIGQLAPTISPAATVANRTGSQTNPFGLVAILSMMLIGIVLRSMIRQSGKSGMRPVTEAIRRKVAQETATEAIRRRAQANDATTQITRASGKRP